MSDGRLRYIHFQECVRFSEKYDLPYERHMQDWPLEVSERSLIDKFWSIYSRGNVTNTEKFICMQIVCYGFEDFNKCGEIANYRIWPDVREALIRDADLLIWLFFDIAYVDDQEAEDPIPIHVLMKELYFESLVDDFPLKDFIDSEEVSN